MDISPSAIEATGISKSFGSVVALDDVDFSARFGEVTGLLGPNGAGKTTLIRILTTILPADGGDFSVAGLPSHNRLGIKSAVGVLPESGGFPKRKTAFDHLVYHARLYGLDLPESADRSAELLRTVGLGGRAHDRIGTFSRGMRQRLGIARALINDPQVLFLDEPTLGLDPAGQQEILELIERLADERQAAVILSSHILDEVERTSDRIVILDQGRVVLDRPALHSGSSSERTDRMLIRLVVASEDAGPAGRVIDRLGLGWKPGSPGMLEVDAGDTDGASGVLRALLEADVSIVRFESGTRRLTEEFLEVTRK